MPSWLLLPTGQMMEFYSEASQSTTAFAIDKTSLTVTSLGIDVDGNVWTGHVKGLIRVRQKQAWDFAAEDKCFSVAIRRVAPGCLGLGVFAVLEFRSTAWVVGR